MGDAAAQSATACEIQTCQNLMQSELFGVKLIEPVDVYLKSNRAVTYGFLFVALTFAAFFLFEILKSLRVHPIQYGLVGCALAIFFLLLFSLAEHIAFAKAYAIAATACIGLIGFYVSFVLASARRGLSFSVLLIALYAALYTLLRSEDHGLLLGTLVSFGMLTIIMVLTRRLNWYQVGQQFGKPDGDPPAKLEPASA
jgi:inner membrane protein